MGTTSEGSRCFYIETRAASRLNKLAQTGRAKGNKDAELPQVGTHSQTMIMGRVLLKLLPSSSLVLPMCSA